MPSFAKAPTPSSQRVPWMIALSLFAAGLTVLVLVLSGLLGSSKLVPPVPPVLISTPTPTVDIHEVAAFQRAHERSPGVHRHAVGIVAKPSSVQQQSDSERFADQTAVHISRDWMGGFYPIYAQAQRVFGVNWLLLASIHRQESAFSTAPGTYQGLNFAGCCAGPMQFNVTNGPVSTWQMVANSYVYGRRPSIYDHHTVEHPSIYDDFDSIMAAAHLLSSDGAGYVLDGSAWDAAYDYYGHDATGVTYADQVLARAISWSQHGFCINCGTEPQLMQAVHDAYGAPVLRALEATSVSRASSGPGDAAKRRKR